MAWSAVLPKIIREWHERRQILREDNAASQAEINALGLDDRNFVNQAKLAAAAGDRQTGIQLWKKAKERYPAFVERYEASFDVALQLQLYDDAEAIAAAGRQREPTEPRHAEDYAMVPERRDNLEEALSRWANVRSRFPTSVKARIHSASCLRRLDRVNEAEELLRKVIAEFPWIDKARIEWVRCAEWRGDWPAVLRRAEEMHDALDHPASAIYIAVALERIGRLDKAAHWLASATVRWPTTIEFPAMQARIAYAQGSKAEAASRWAHVKERFPLSPIGYQGQLSLLRELGRCTEAEVVALEAIGRFPLEPWPAVEYAKLAEQQERWEQAADRWAVVRQKWPDRRDGFEQGALALRRLDRAAEAAALSQTT